MKTDRLLSIIIYLLNHDAVNASKLADKFEVSKRTILRDIEQISLAGIPIKSVPGVNGGYSIMEGYKLDGRLVTAEDQTSIITALKGFLSAYDGKRYNDILEKITYIVPRDRRQTVFFDFGASGENYEIQTKMKALEQAIDNRISMQISYVSASGETSDRIIEPLALSYRWYAWYLLAYCTTKQDYRIFKLARISKLEPTKMGFSRKHVEPSALLDKVFENGNRKRINVSLLCKHEVVVQVREYLGGTIEKAYDNGDIILRMSVMEDERMWFAMLMSFGDKVTVLEPDELRIRIAETARNILSAYNKQ